MRIAFLACLASTLLFFSCKSPIDCGGFPFEYDPVQDRCVCEVGMLDDAGSMCLLPDGGVDGGPCTTGDTQPCEADADGACANGTQTCEDGTWGECMPGSPSEEICDGVDNDCDTVTDGPAATAACPDVDRATSSVCSATTCTVADCVDGYGDCNEEHADGCEAQFASDAMHCGACNRSCSTGMICEEGDCVAPPVHRWSLSSYSEATMDVYEVDVDGSGNIYLVGDYLRPASFLGRPLESDNRYHGYVASFTAAGDLRWLARISGTSTDFPTGLDVQEDGTTCVVGRFAGTASVHPGMGATMEIGTATGTDAYLLCFSGNGAVTFASSYGGAGDDRFSDIVSDDDGNLYVTGRFETGATFGSSPPTFRGGQDGIVLSYGPSGGFRWQRPFGGSGQDLAGAVSARGSRVVAALGIEGAVTVGTETYADDGVLVELDMSGMVVWSEHLGGGGVTEVAIADEGVFVAGNYSGDLRFGERTAGGIGGNDGFLAFLDRSMDVAWIATVTGPGNEGVNGISLVGDAVVATGSHEDAAAIDGELLLNRGAQDVWFAGFSPTGERRWAQVYGGDRFDTGKDLVGVGGDVVAVGRHYRTSVGGDTLDSNGVVVFVARYRVE